MTPRVLTDEEHAFLYGDGKGVPMMPQPYAAYISPTGQPVVPAQLVPVEPSNFGQRLLGASTFAWRLDDEQVARVRRAMIAHGDDWPNRHYETWADFVADFPDDGDGGAP